MPADPRSAGIGTFAVHENRRQIAGTRMVRVASSQYADAHDNSPVIGDSDHSQTSLRFPFEGERSEQRLHIDALTLKQKQARMKHRVFQNELGGTQQIQRMNLGH